jgi:hypothetical protein
METIGGVRGNEDGKYQGKLCFVVLHKFNGCTLMIAA